MNNLYLKKFISEFRYFKYLFKEKIFKNNGDINAKQFVDKNNKSVSNFLKHNEVQKVSILLPHCIQKYDCDLKITSNINNCKQCGLCDISDILKLKDEFKNIDIKIATGGTLARLYLKEYRPDLVIAVACKRDLTSGIRDCFPIRVYGVFNKIVNGPCINTKVMVDNLREVLR